MSDEITFTRDDGIERWIDDLGEKVSGTALAELRAISKGIVDSLKGAEARGASWKIETIYSRARKGSVRVGIATGTREDHEWPVKTGRSRAAWVAELRVQGDDIETVVTNPLRYAWMVNARHDKSNTNSATLLVRTPMRKASNKFAEDFADLFAESVK
tara:strand:- start:1020 stop:1493 length:474 start_codon:yes stop_codon:yes gene_type:complete